MVRANITGYVIVLYTITSPGSQVADEEQKSRTKDKGQRTKEERKNVFSIYIRYSKETAKE